MRMPQRVASLTMARLKAGTARTHSLPASRASNLHTATPCFEKFKPDPEQPFSISSAITAIPVTRLPFQNRGLRPFLTPTIGGQHESIHSINQILDKPLEGDYSERADRIWSLYMNLSAAYRRTIPLATTQRICLAVIPPIKEVLNTIGNPHTRHPAVMKTYRQNVLRLASKWEERLRTTSVDLFFPRPSETSQTVPDQPVHETIYMGMKKLALLGDRSGCESILREMEERLPKQIRVSRWQDIYDCSLRSVVRWLYLNQHRANTAQGEIKEAVEALRRIITNMQEKDIPANEQTGLALLDAARYILTSIKDERLAEGIVSLAALVLNDGYGVKEGPLGWEGLRPELPTSVKLVIIELLGKENRLWHMVLAFEKMYPDRERVLLSQEEHKIIESEEDEIPTLSIMMAKERQESLKRDWLGRKREEATVDEAPEADIDSATEGIFNPPSKFSDFLPPVPSPSEIFSRYTDDPALTVARSISTAPRAASAAQRDAPFSYIIKSMLHYAWLGKHTPGHAAVARHIFQHALRVSHVEQALWINALLRDGEPSTKAPPALGVDPKWFASVWRIERHKGGKKRRGIAKIAGILTEMEEAEGRLLEEVDILRSASERAGEIERDVVERTHSATFDISSRLETIESTIEELASLRQGIEHSAQVIAAQKHRARIRKAAALEEKMESERMNNEEGYTENQLKGGEVYDVGRSGKLAAFAL